VPAGHRGGDKEGARGGGRKKPEGLTLPSDDDQVGSHGPCLPLPPPQATRRPPFDPLRLQRACNYYPPPIRPGPTPSQPLAGSPSLLPPSLPVTPFIMPVDDAGSKLGKLDLTPAFLVRPHSSSPTSPAKSCFCPAVSSLLISPSRPRGIDCAATRACAKPGRLYASPWIYDSSNLHSPSVINGQNEPGTSRRRWEPQRLRRVHHQRSISRS
jgi:hypothetical protein